jgi:large subunit ribosomal protein L3
MTTSNKAIIAKKIGMTRMVDANGYMVAVTLLKVESQSVTKVLNKERDGYDAFQIGYYEKREKHLTKADVARLRKVNIAKNFVRFREIRTDGALEGYGLGADLSAAIFEGVEAVDVTGVTKGRGHTGALKRWNVACGRMTHGSRHHRRPGSLGTRTTPGRVFKNKPQTGQYGSEQVTIQNLSVMDIDKQNNVIALKGAIPGHREGFVLIRPSIKA